ncbi:ABC transporter ATP-binding protein [Limnochorda pilosa]|uniref:ABC transporter ATP-binding protein n=1 Tax=Limnochorda pilosa TaxID=1555112 RepID=UPI000837467A|nr:ABC transporter ATP-binding protein [Limnochorda pilosa]
MSPAASAPVPEVATRPSDAGRRSVALRLLQYARPHLRAALGGLLCMLVVSGTELVLPLIFGQGIVREVLSVHSSMTRITQLVLLIVGLMLVRGLFRYGRGYLLGYTAQRLVADLRRAVHQKLQELSLDFHQRHRTGELVSRITFDAAQIQAGVGRAIGDLAGQLLTLAGVLFFLIYLNARMALVSLIILALAGWAIDLYGRRIRRASRRVQERMAGIAAALQEMLGAIRVVKAFTLQRSLQGRFDQENEAGFEAQMKSVQLEATVTPVVELVTAVGVAAILWVGGWEILHGRMDAGGFMSFVGYLALVLGPVGGISHTSAQLQQAAAAAQRVFELLDEPDRVAEPPVPRRLPRCKGRVSFEDVWFAYEPGQWVLRGIDLKVEPGQRVALVGPSGAGKSTLVNLIPRFYDVARGTVRVDGIDVRELSIEDLRRAIGLVPQETVLFGVSVLENLAYGRSGATREEIEAAARAANAHDFIMELPQGYETRVGERGATLSGGQRQRIAIARALLRDPRLLILDEATSSLDAPSERLVQEALERLMRDRTSFVVAHRLSTVVAADRILVVDGGRVVEEGTHAELMNRRGLYRSLFEAQSREGVQTLGR